MKIKQIRNATMIVTHIHIDHFDPAAIELIPKDMKMFAQNDDEARQMNELGFKNLEVLKEEGTIFEGIKLIKTPAKHYSEESMLEIFKLGNMTEKASGVIFNHSEEKSLYIMGDTVWYDGIKNVLYKYTPEIIAVNAGNAKFVDGRYLIMSKEEFFEAVKAAPYAKFLATHMEGVNHLTLSREDLSDYAKEMGFEDKLSIPADGETCEF
jgi:L-ascorbate metabolism protein UlaG (beta-lactamase superfamily)